MTRNRFSVALMAALFVVSGCATYATSVASAPPQRPPYRALVVEPNVLAPGRAPGVIRIDLSQVPAEPVCTGSHAIQDICVADLRTSLRHGLTAVLNDFYGRADNAPSLTSTFKVVEFSSSLEQVGMGGGMESYRMQTGTVRLDLRWQFQLLDAAGRPLVQLAETTHGSRKFEKMEDVDASLKTLLEEALERVAKGLADRPKPAEWIPASAPPAVIAEG